MYSKVEKALANEGTLLPTQMFLRLPARATFVEDTNFVYRTKKLFLILFRNILCPQQMFPRGGRKGGGGGGGSENRKTRTEIRQKKNRKPNRIFPWIPRPHVLLAFSCDLDDFSCHCRALNQSIRTRGCTAVRANIRHGISRSRRIIAQNGLITLSINWKRPWLQTTELNCKLI